MSKEQILKKTICKLRQLDKNTLKEADDFVQLVDMYIWESILREGFLGTKG